MKEGDPSLILQTPNERMSDLATDIAYLTNLRMKPGMSRDDLHEISIKIRQLEKEKQSIYEQFKGGET